MGMMIAAPGALKAGYDSPVLYRGAYKEIIPKLSADGYKAVELHILDSDEIDRQELWRLLEQNDVRLTSIGTGSVYEAKGINLGDRDRLVRQQAIRHLESHMVTAEPSHALIIVGLIAGRYRDAGLAEGFQKNLTESLYDLDGLAKKHDVRIGFEIMNSYESDFLTTIDAGIQYLQEQTFERICLHLDSLHMNIEETDIGAAIRRAGKLVGHVHIADNDGWYPGHGHINFREILQALYEIGYDGTLALETYNRPDTQTSARRGLNFLSFLLEEIEGKK